MLGETFTPDLVLAEDEDVGPTTYTPLVGEPGAVTAVLAGPAERRDGLRVTSIVVREHATEVRCHDVSRRWRAEGPAGSLDDLRLADDLGTAYGEPIGGEAFASHHAASGTWRFEGPVPPEARTLTLTWGGGSSSCDAVRS